MTNGKKATAVLSHGASNVVTREELAALSTPEPTKTWSPVPHASVPALIETAVKERGWHFEDEHNPFRISVTPDGSKMFGVTGLIIPGMLDGEEFGLAVGFRNSHDKSFSLQMAVGTRVFVCDNLMINGEFKVRREHTVRISVEEEITKAFGYVPEVATKTIDWFGGMRQIAMSREEGVAFLAQCVECKALPIMDFMDARSSFLNGFVDDASIKHGGTLWSAYQAVTAEWKKHSLMQLPNYSHQLNTLAKERLS